jgi:hypothetical protein
MPTTSPLEGPNHHGPKDPFHPVGDVEVLTHTDSGADVLRQQYSDGYIYEYMMPSGVAVEPGVAPATPFLTGKVIRTYEEGGFHFVAVWVPNEEGEIHAKLYQEAASKPNFEYDAGPQSEPETLHEDEHVTVTRVRYSTGWMYLVNLQMGFPWPSFFLLPCLTPTRTAPVVGIESAGTSFLAKFWCSDASPHSPGAN